MKKRILSILTALCLCLSLLPTAALAASIPDDHKFTLSFTGDCYTTHKETVTLKDYLPESAVVTEMSSILPSVVNSFTPEHTISGNANVEDAKFSYTTCKCDEPTSGALVVTVSTSNLGDYVFTINITLTGKYLVTLSAISQTALYNGQPHEGYRNLKGTLTSGTNYDGNYSFVYAEKNGTPLDGAPSEVGDYTVTISIPDDNADYKHKEVLTLAFSIIANAEAQYQTEANGAWLNDTFEQALANVYAGGTVKLLKDVVLSQTATAAKKMTITSADTSTPCTITSNTDKHGYLLNITDEVKLENVIVDGGSKNNITAKRAAISVNGGKLTLGSGAVVRNNKNQTTQGIGGGVCVISGELYLDGATITGNDGYFGGGVGMAGGTFYAKSGTITGNTSKMGGGINVWMLKYDDNNITYGTLHLSGTVAITKNKGEYYADGILCYSSGVTIDLSGAPTIEGGIYLDHYVGGPNVSIVLSELDDEADILICTFKPQSGMIMAVPALGYTITPDDFSKLRFEEDTFGLKFDDSGNVVLTDVGVYQITFDANGGNIKTATTKTADGKLIYLPAPTRNGYTFAGWFTEAEGGEQVTADTVFSADTTIYAHWRRISSSKYTISAEDTENGTVTADRKSASKGTTVTITVTPDEGYALETITVTDKSGSALELTNKGDGTYTFKMPASTVTVGATFAPEKTVTDYFADVPADSYYADAVLWAAKKGVTGGVDKNHFAPDLPCTRAQIVTFLWRATGSPSPVSMNSFADISAEAYYAKAVAWAVENGITDGMGDNLFVPDLTCTRAQAVTFLFRYAAYLGMDTATIQELVAGYNDAAQVPGYALSAFNWALADGVVQGYDNSLMPNDDCTRAQIVTMLYRLLGE